jgi:hypothetical protein
VAAVLRHADHVEFARCHSVCGDPFLRVRNI